MGGEIRKSLRLSTIDYRNGTFFITMCAKNMSCIFGSVISADENVFVDLSETGQSIENTINYIGAHDENVLMEKFIIMPNHVHILITVKNTDVSGVVRRIKTFVQKERGNNIWQRTYMEHKIRNMNDFQTHWMYIDNNPKKWAFDKYFRNHE